LNVQLNKVINDYKTHTYYYLYFESEEWMWDVFFALYFFLKIIYYSF